MKRFKLFFALIILLNLGIWFYARPLQAKWRNVPPAPSQSGLLAGALSDGQLAYRMSGMMLQNLGSVGGQTQSLEKYDYGALEKWFFVNYHLDSRPSFIPFLAAYYYGATDNPEQVAHVVNFLETAGNDVRGQRWRWLVHAVFLAKHKMKDPARATEIADKLAALKDTKIPAWTKHLNVLLRNERGDKEDAYNMMLGILASEAATMDPTEVKFIVDYVCDSILTPDKAKTDPVCKDR